MDEFTYLLLLIIMMCFTHFVPDPQQRSHVGIAYICVMFTNIGIHLITLIRSTLASLIKTFKKYCVSCCKKKIKSMPSN